MPSTINGIGTHYYGSQNLSVRVAACNSCHRVGNLSSYDTRLWFVVVFIPVIPLGRKRILDKCPTCTRHYAVDAAEYEQKKQLQTSASLERFRREPSADAAAVAHAQLMEFREHEQAADFRREALERFPDDAGLRAGMAETLRDMSLFNESARLFQESLDIDPDLPEARVGVARRKMAEGDLDEAQDLLDFLTEPGAGRQYSLGPVDQLAAALQRAGRHEEALRLADVLLREIPKLDENHAFRSFVRTSEKALGRPDSLVSERGFSLGALFRSEGSHYAPWQRKLAIGSVAAALLLGGLAVNNDYVRKHRTLHVLNATGQPAQVQVDDKPAVQVVGMGEVVVPEGPHVVKVAGPVNETHNIAMESGYFERWSSKPAWVLNLGGEGVLEDVTHVYSANGTPGHRQLLVGETFFQRPHVDYLFTPAPAQMNVKRKSQEVTKTEIGWFQADDFQAFRSAFESNRAAAMAFAGKRLARNPNQPELLKYYVGLSSEAERGPIEAFLKAGLDRRPVDVPWHRAYQTVAELNGHDKDLAASYDGYLAAEPGSAPLLYLRGRVDADWSRQTEFYQQAMRADPKLGWPWLATAARAAAEGQWEACETATLKARELNMGEQDGLAEYLHEARIATGKAGSLVDEYRARVAADPEDFSALFLLVDALAASGQEGEIEPVVSGWVSRLPGPLQGQFAPQLRALGLYYAGKLKECVEFCRSGAAVSASKPRLHAMLALGQSKDAADDPAFRPLWDDPSNLLAVSVGLGLDGKAEDSAAWREKAATALKEPGGESDTGKAAKLLTSAEAPQLEDVDRLFLPAEVKTLLLVELADRFPDRRDAFLAEAARFNVSRKPSYHLIARATGSGPAARP